MIHFIPEGNIFKIEGVRNYAHGCNCHGAMGAGIALQFREKYPKMYDEYHQLCSDGKYNLGDIYVYNTEKETIFNLATQSSWTSRAELWAIEESVRKMLQYASTHQIEIIALPAIGAGLGGGDWQEIKEVISGVAEEYTSIEVFVVESFKDIELKI